MKRLFLDWRKTRDLVGALYRAWIRNEANAIARKALHVQYKRKMARHAVRLANARQSQAWHFDGIRD